MNNRFAIYMFGANFGVWVADIDWLVALIILINVVLIAHDVYQWVRK